MEKHITLTMVGRMDLVGAGLAAGKSMSGAGVEL